MTTPQLTLNDATTIPQIGYGLFLVPENEAQRCVENALESGYRHLDTASIYHNETAVGRALAATGIPRNEIYITTKLWNADQGRHTTRPALHASLERLGLDYVNLYLIHWPTPERNLYSESWEILEELANEGLTHSIGVSNFLPDHLDTIINTGGRIPAVNQIEVHPTLPQHELTTANTQRNITTQAWSPLGRGIDLELPDVTAIAQAHNATPAQTILAWHLAQGHIVLPKTTNPKRMAENLASASLQLTPQEMNALSTLNTGERVGPNPATFNEI